MSFLRRLFARWCQCEGCRCRRGEQLFKPVSTFAEPNVVWARLPEGPEVALSPRQARLMADYLRDAASNAEWLHEVRERNIKAVGFFERGRLIPPGGGSSTAPREWDIK